MRWLLLLLLLAAGVAVYRMAPVQTTISEDNGVRSLQVLTEEVLQPVNSKNALTRADADKALTEITSKVMKQQSDPSSARTLRAVALLKQAVNERDTYLSQVRSGSAVNKLDEVPGKWHVAGHPEKPVDRVELSRKTRSAFWTDAAVREWQKRCDYYRAASKESLGAHT